MNKIAIILPFLTLGGAETQAFNISKGFIKEGIPVKFFAFEKRNGLLIEKLESEGIEYELLNYDLNVIHAKGLKKISDLRNVISALRKFKATHLFPLTYYPNIIISSIWKFTGAKQCYWNQRGLENTPLNAIEKIAIKMKPKYISNSKNGADFIQKRHQNQIDVTVIPNSIKLKEAKQSPEEWKEKLNINNEEVYIMVANLYKEKNHEYLLEAWQEYSLESKNDKKLIFVGYSSREQDIWRIKSKAYDLNISNLLIIPSTNDITGLLSICEVGIITSSREGCPNSLLEYMAKGMISIASKIPATEEILPSNYEFFCDLSNYNSLVAALKLSENRAVSKITIKQNQKIISEKYSEEQLTCSYLKLVQ